VCRTKLGYEAHAGTVSCPHGTVSHAGSGITDPGGSLHDCGIKLSTMDVISTHHSSQPGLATDTCSAHCGRA
jgi:hypothetical protein